RRQGQLAQEGAARAGPAAAGWGGRLLAAEQGEAEGARLAVVAEALGAGGVGQAALPQGLQQGAQPLRRGGVRVAAQDAEAVAVQVAGLELVAVPADAQQANAITLQPVQAALGSGRD